MLNYWDIYNQIYHVKIPKFPIELEIKSLIIAYFPGNYESDIQEFSWRDSIQEFCLGDILGTTKIN